MKARKPQRNLKERSPTACVNALRARALRVGSTNRTEAQAKIACSRSVSGSGQSSGAGSISRSA
jgi:hypothetical protein